MTSIASPSPLAPAPRRRRALADPWIWAAAGVWIALNLLVLQLARGFLPFDRPALAGKPFALQMALPSLGLMQVLILMGVVGWLTRRRAVPDIGARAPDRKTAWRETLGLIAWAMLGQAGGWLLGPLLGYRPFSFHLAGTLFGCSTPPESGEVLVWASYNFLAFAVAPLLWFGRRYRLEALNLRSTDRANDLLVIGVVMLLEGATELAAFPGVFAMTPRGFALAAPAALLAFFFGTVLPTMVLIYAILLPRYRALTGSAAATVVLGGVSYAAMHLVEGWSNFSSPTDTALSLAFVFLGYFGPGMFKAFVTLRTGNAWVHALGYHAVAPHVLVDAPLIGKAFGLL